MRKLCLALLLVGSIYWIWVIIGAWWFGVPENAFEGVVIRAIAVWFLFQQVLGCLKELTDA